MATQPRREPPKPHAHEYAREDDEQDIAGVPKKEEPDANRGGDADGGKDPAISHVGRPPRWTLQALIRWHRTQRPTDASCYHSSAYAGNATTPTRAGGER